MKSLFIEVINVNNNIDTYFHKSNDFFSSILTLNNAKTLCFHNFNEKNYELISSNETLNYSFIQEEVIELNIENKEIIVALKEKESNEIIFILFINFDEVTFNNLDLGILNLIIKPNKKASHTEEIKIIKAALDNLYKLRYKVHLLSENLYYDIKKKLINNSQLNELKKENDFNLSKLIKVDNEHYFYEAKNFNNIINSYLVSLIEENLRLLEIKICTIAILNRINKVSDKVITEFFSIASQYKVDLETLKRKLIEEKVKPINDLTIPYSFFNVNSYKDYFLELINSGTISYSNKLNSFYNFYNLSKVSSKELFKFLVLKEIEDNFIKHNFISLNNTNYYYCDYTLKKDLYFKGNNLKAKITILKNRRYVHPLNEFNFYPSFLIEVANEHNEKLRNVVIDFLMDENDFNKNKDFKNLTNNLLVGSFEFKNNSLMLGEERINLYLYVFLRKAAFNRLIDLKEEIIKKYTLSIKNNLKSVFSEFFDDLLLGDELI